MSAKHTPGPWYIHGDGGTTIVGGEGDCWEHICSVTANEDARLIAAAPELLEALEHVLHRIEAIFDADGVDRQDICEDLDILGVDVFRAIAKAKGE